MPLPFTLVSFSQCSSVSGRHPLKGYVAHIFSLLPSFWGFPRNVGCNSRFLEITWKNINFCVAKHFNCISPILLSGIFCISFLIFFFLCFFFFILILPPKHRHKLYCKIRYSGSHLLFMNVAPFLYKIHTIFFFFYCF